MLIKRIYSYLDVKIGPSLDLFLPYPVLVMSWRCKKCGKEYKEKSFRQFLFELCDCRVSD